MQRLEVAEVMAPSCKLLEFWWARVGNTFLYAAFTL